MELGSRNEKPLTRYFPELVEALRRELPHRCVLDGEVVIAGPHGLDFDALSQRIHPAEKRIRQLAEATPASFVAFDVLAHDDESSWSRPTAPPRKVLEKLLAKARPPVHLTPVTQDPDVAADWFSRFEGAGLDGVVAKASDLALPAGQAGHAQGQAPAHGRVRGGRLPHAQGRCRRRFAAAGPLRRRGDAPSRRRGLGVQCGPAPRAGRRARARTAQGALEEHPWGAWAEAGRADPGRHQPLERRQGHDLGGPPARGGVRGLLRPPPGRPVPSRHVVRAMAPRPRSGVVHLRAARHARCRSS